MYLRYLTLQLKYTYMDGAEAAAKIRDKGGAGAENK